MIKIQARIGTNKPAIFQVESEQEAHALAKGLLKGHKVKILTQPKIDQARIRNTHTNLIWGKNGIAENR